MLSLEDLKKEVVGLNLSMKDLLEDDFLSTKWTSYEDRIVQISQSIQQTINVDSVQKYSQAELDSLRQIEESYSQMLVVIKDKMLQVSEELRKIKKREEIKSIYNKL